MCYQLRFRQRLKCSSLASLKGEKKIQLSKSASKNLFVGEKKFKKENGQGEGERKRGRTVPA